MQEKLPKYIKRRKRLYEKLKKVLAHIMQKRFAKYIDDRKKFYDELKDIQLHEKEWSKPIKLDTDFFNELVSNPNFRDEIKKRNYFDFDEIKNYKGTAVYRFRIEQSGEEKIEELIEHFDTQKKRKKDLAWTKLSKNRGYTDCLYLGKMEKNLYGRFIEHLGLGAKTTSALRLCEWISCDLVFEFIKLEDVDKKYLEDIENFFWRRYNPLIGKEPNIKE